MYPEFQQIYWYSGVYLQPQHFQSVDLHHNYMLSRHRQLSHPWNVGIIHCDFNPDTLVDFRLKIDRLQALLPSGDYLEYPGNCMLRSRQFRDVWQQLEKPFTLWLALRRFDPSHINVGDSTNSRWVKPQHEDVMKDVYSSSPECSVSRIIYNVQILSDEEKKDVVDCEFLPLLQLRYENDRAIVDPYFCPPLVTLNGSPVLKALLDGLYAELANRAHQLAEYKRPDKSGNTERADMTQVLIMCSLNRTLPLLDHYCHTPMVHPWVIYGLLVQLAGELSSFSEQCTFNGEWEGESQLSAYDHSNLYLCFTRARKLIINLLNNLTLEDNIRVALSADDQRVFRGNLQSMPWGIAGSVLLMLRSETLTVAECSRCTDFKIAPESTMLMLIQHALPGITVSWLSQTPHRVP
ncbi:type VI secretion system baseplate subunit TssK, partial [Citrobacter portucalensis]